MKANLLLLMLSMMWAITFAQSESLFDRDSFHQLEFAHRGGYHGMSENTIETVVQNIREGNVNAIEVDVMMTKDSVMILFHDDTLGRILQYDGQEKVSELTADEIRSHAFRARGSEGQKVSLFDDLVDTLIHLAVIEKQQFVLEIDFKANGDNAVGASQKLLAHVLETEAVYDKAIYDYFFVSTFYPSVLAELRKLSPDIRLANAVHAHYMGGGIKPKLGAWLILHFAKKYNAMILEANQCYLTKRRVKRWKRKGYRVHSYTSNSKSERDYVKNTLGIAMTTNCPLTTECPHDPSDEYVPKKWCKKCK